MKNAKKEMTMEDIAYENRIKKFEEDIQLIKTALLQRIA
jgi:hypothetical protein